jgi:hypothetical protein
MQERYQFDANETGQLLVGPVTGNMDSSSGFTPVAFREIAP